MARPRVLPTAVVPWTPERSAGATRDAEGRPLIRLQTLGASVILCGETRVGPSADVLFALLLRLTHAPGMQLSREVLLQALWPSQSDARRRGSLRQALYKLRGAGVRVALDGDTVRLDASQVVRTFSLSRTPEYFERDVTRGDEPFGPFLPGYVPPFASVEEWLTLEREAVHADVRRVLVAQLRGRRERADWTGAEALARWLLQFDALHEDATLTIAECAMMAGAKTEAIAMLDRYLAEIGPNAGDIRLPAEKLRRRFVESTRGRLSFAPTERHFVGRETEVAALTIAMRRARWHDGSAVLLYGPPGMGKTRLTHEMAKVATIEGVRELRVGCRESDRHRQFAVFLDLLPEMLSLPGALGCAPDSLSVLRRVSPWPVDALSLDSASGVRSVEPQSPDPESPQTEPASVARLPRERTSIEDTRSDGEIERIGNMDRFEPLPVAASIRRSLVDLFAAVSEERTVFLVVDDAHWIDPCSWDVVADLVECASKSRIFILLTSREPHACSLRPEQIPVALSCVPLQPLSEESSAALARLIGVDLDADINAATSRWFVSASEGSPLFLRCLVNNWIETGQYGGVPPTLSQVFESRLLRLTPQSLRLLQAAAVLGRYATVQRLETLLQLSTIDTLHSLEELASIGAFRESTGEAVLCHELLSSAAISKLSKPVAHALHLRCAQLLRGELADDSGAVSSAVAEHLARAGAELELAEFVRDAVVRLIRRGYAAGALAVFETVDAIDTKLLTRHEVRVLELEALYLAGRHSRLLERVSQGISRFDLGRGWDASHPTDALQSIEASTNADDPADYSDLCARAVLLAETEDVPVELRFKAALSGIKLAGHALDSSLAERAFTAGSSLVVDNGGTTASKHRLNLYYHTVFGDLDTAVVSLRLLSDGIDISSLAEDELRFGSDIGFAMKVAGMNEEAKTQFQAVYRRAQAFNDSATAGVAAWYMSLLALDSDDDLSSSRRWMSRCESLPGVQKIQMLSAMCAQQRTRFALLDQDLDESRRENALSKEFLPRLSHPRRVAAATALDLGIAILAREHDKLQQLLPLALDTHQRIGGMLGQDYFTSQIAESLFTLRREREAMDFLLQYTTSQRRERGRLPAFMLRTAARAKPTRLL